MLTLEITRDGDRSIGDQLAEMHAWLADRGIEAVKLRASRVIAGRVRYEVAFAKNADAERFRSHFDDG